MPCLLCGADVMKMIRRSRLHTKLPSLLPAIPSPLPRIFYPPVMGEVGNLSSTGSWEGLRGLSNTLLSLTIYIRSRASRGRGSKAKE